MKIIILVSLAVAVLCAAGCSTSSASGPTSNSTQIPNSTAATAPPPGTGVTTLEGAWHGHEITPDGQAPASIIFSGQSMEFHGADPNDWAKGTFTLNENTHPKQLLGVILDCADPNAIGKKGYVIYKIEHGTLTLTGSGPGGVLDFPTAFDASGTRQFVFKHE